jgi:hypothetical protein
MGKKLRIRLQGGDLKLILLKAHNWDEFISFLISKFEVPSILRVQAELDKAQIDQFELLEVWDPYEIIEVISGPSKTHDIADPSALARGDVQNADNDPFSKPTTSTSENAAENTNNLVKLDLCSVEESTTLVHPHQIPQPSESVIMEDVKEILLAEPNAAEASDAVRADDAQETTSKLNSTLLVTSNSSDLLAKEPEHTTPANISVVVPNAKSDPKTSTARSSNRHNHKPHSQISQQSESQPQPQATPDIFEFTDEPVATLRLFVFVNESNFTSSSSPELGIRGEFCQWKTNTLDFHNAPDFGSGFVEHSSHGHRYTAALMYVDIPLSRKDQRNIESGSFSYKYVRGARSVKPEWERFHRSSDSDNRMLTSAQVTCLPSSPNTLIHFDDSVAFDYMEGTLENAATGYLRLLEDAPLELLQSALAQLIVLKVASPNLSHRPKHLDAQNIVNRSVLARIKEAYVDNKKKTWVNFFMM